MEEHEAWEKATGIVVHGDELARRHLAEDLSSAFGDLDF